MSANFVLLHGNLTRDPELREVGTKTSVVNFGIASSRYFKKQDGSKGQDTVFVDCEAWDSGADLIKRLLKKGDPVIIEGALKMDQWEKDGQKHSKLKIRVNNFTKLPRGEKGAEDASTESSDDIPVATVVTADAEDDKTPF